MKRNQKPARATPTATPPPTPPETAATSSSPLSWLNHATIFITLLTFCGYFAAFSYEAAYLEYFRIPYYFISLNPTVVFFTSAIWIAVVPLFVYILVLPAVGNALEPVDKQIKQRFPRSVKMAVILISISVVALLIFKYITDQEYRKTWTIETALIFVAFFALWALFRSSYRRYKEGKKEALWGVIALLFAGGFLVLYIEFRLQSVVGRKVAQDQKVFHVYALPSSTSEVAVIRNYGEYLLTVPFNRDPNGAGFETKLVIVKMSDIKTPLTLENIGPLRAKP